jgi:hypothetical protein
MSQEQPLVELELEFLRPAQGGRKQPPQMNDQQYRPHLRVPPSSEMLGVEFVRGPESPMPIGVPIRATARFLYEPQVSYAALQSAVAIEVLEGPKVVARGKVIRLLHD